MALHSFNEYSVLYVDADPRVEHSPVVHTSVRAESWGDAVRAAHNKLRQLNQPVKIISVECRNQFLD